MTTTKRNIFTKIAMGAGFATLVGASSLHSSADKTWSSYENAPPHLILSVTATHATMQEKYSYQYLRLFSDASVECDSPAKSTHSTLRTRLSDDEFSKVRSTLSDPRLFHLKASYETRYAVLDSSTAWKIDFLYKDKIRNVDVLEFSPELAKTMKHPYPEVLVRLGCTVLQLRQEVSGEPVHLDSECRKYLAN
jgi:hypothetical protein